MHSQARSRFTDILLHRETLRRRSFRTVAYMQNVALANLSEIRRFTKPRGTLNQLQVNSSIDLLEKFLKDATLYVLANLYEIQKLDDANIRRKERLDYLSQFVQTRIRSLQNPSDCTRAKILLAGTSCHCGYGCQTHYYMFCLNMAYATGRTLIPDSQKTSCIRWWAKTYMPLSEKCSIDDVGRDEVIVGK
ncbi:unnamed protein product [Calicophoron daubneyi]|uniref:GT23 domain-containing protein n=1 Tax=Calicophoron daubneyi TaxID=300641 RepID=A0AAV2TED8_CALDB